MRTAQELRRAPAAVLALLVSFGTAHAADWSVDPSGSGDFTEIAAAVASPLVVDGDRLWVAPGEYANFTTAKGVSILALTGSTFTTVSATFDGAPHVTISGMRVNTLVLRAVPGRALVSGCEIGLPAVVEIPAPLYYGGARVEDCAQVVFTHSVIRGTSDCYPDWTSGTGGSSALQVRGSRVALHACLVRGGDDVFFAPECNPHYGGAPAVEAIDGSVIDIVASELRSGASPWVPAPALQLVNAVADVRGNSAHLLVAGHPGSLAVHGVGAAKVTGVTAVPSELPAWVVTAPGPAPFLVGPEHADIGGPLALDLYGPAGAPVLALLALRPGIDGTLLPGDGWLWFDPFSAWVAVPTVTLGHESASTLVLALPPLPSLVGIALTAQAYFPFAAPGDRLTPPADVLVR